MLQETGKCGAKRNDFLLAAVCGRRALAALSAALLLLTPSPAQTPPQKVPGPPAPASPSTNQEPGVIRITVSLVQIDAVVTDSKGKQVTNLEPKDFEVLQDGKPQKITNFSYITLQHPATGAPSTPKKPNAPSGPVLPAVPLRPEQVRRTIALVVDDLGLSFEGTAYVRQAVKKFVDTQMQPGDLVAILRTSAGMGALQQFTSDQRVLYAAIDRVRWYPFGRKGVAAFPALNSGTTADDTNLEAFRQEIFTVGTLGALNYVVQGLRELPGRKSVVLLSEGFPFFSREDPGANSRVTEALRRLTDLANRASVVMYAIDARGLPTLQFTAADDTSGLSTTGFQDALNQRREQYFDSQTGMVYLAEQTGGFFVHDNNDIDGGLRTILDDLTGYYLIGFKPDPITFNAKKAGPDFHKIKVKVNVPGLHVRSRTGFYGVPDEEKPVYRTRSDQLIAALTSPFGSGDVHLKLTSLFSDDARGGPLVRSLLHIDAHDLTFTDEPDGLKKTVIDVLAITFGDSGAMIDQVDRTYTMKLKPDQYKQSLERGFLYTTNVPIRKSGAYQLRVALRDPSSQRVGSASQFIEVPDVRKGKLAVSGIWISADPSQLKTKGQDQADTEDQARASSEGSPAVRVFHPGSAIVYTYQIYNAHFDSHGNAPEVQVQTRVFRDGREIFSGKPATVKSTGQTDLKRVATAGELRLGPAMEPGDYVLQVTVTDNLAKPKYRTATQWIDFEVIRPEKQATHGGS